MTRTLGERRRRPAAISRRKRSGDKPRRSSHARRLSETSNPELHPDTDSLVSSGSPHQPNPPKTFCDTTANNQRPEEEKFPNAPQQANALVPAHTKKSCPGAGYDASGASEPSTPKHSISTTTGPNTTTLVRKSRRGRPRGTHNDRFVVVCNGRYEIPRHPDLKQLRRFRPEPGAGWCKKYWWDYSAQLNFDRDDETGGVILAYSENHQKALRRVHVALSMALKDETAPLTLPTPKPTTAGSGEHGTNAPRELEGAIPRRFQTLQDHLRFPVESVPSRKPEDGVHDTSRRALRDWERHRLLVDATLGEEYSRQQRLRNRPLQ